VGRYLNDIPLIIPIVRESQLTDQKLTTLRKTWTNRTDIAELIRPCNVNVTQGSKNSSRERERGREREREEFGSSLRRKKSRLSLLQYLPMSPPSLL
jgi:hypothetical protein